MTNSNKYRINSNVFKYSYWGRWEVLGSSVDKHCPIPGAHRSYPQGGHQDHRGQWDHRGHPDQAGHPWPDQGPERVNNLINKSKFTNGHIKQKLQQWMHTLRTCGIVSIIFMHEHYIYSHRLYYGLRTMITTDTNFILIPTSNILLAGRMKWDKEKYEGKTRGVSMGRSKAGKKK